MVEIFGKRLPGYARIGNKRHAVDSGSVRGMSVRVESVLADYEFELVVARFDFRVLRNYFVDEFGIVVRRTFYAQVRIRDFFSVQNDAEFFGRENSIAPLRDKSYVYRGSSRALGFEIEFERTIRQMNVINELTSADAFVRRLHYKVVAVAIPDTALPILSTTGVYSASKTYTFIILLHSQ